MTGFGGRHGYAHSFRVAHFADHDDVRSLAQGGTKGGGEIGCIGAYFHLLDDAAHVLMLVLDGIFDDDDMTGFAAIDDVDQRGERSGFAGTRGTADENEPAREMRERVDRSWPGELAKGGNPCGQHANSGVGASLFALQGDAETGQALHARGE